MILFLTEYFIINSKITAFCIRNRSAVLAYISIHTQVAVDGRTMMRDIHIYTHTYAHPWSYMCTFTHTHLGCFSYSTSRSASITHTPTSRCVLEICLMMTHTYTHLYLCSHLIACTNTYFSSTFTGAFPLHACVVTCNWHTNFSSVWRVFLVAMVDTDYCETSGREALVF